MIDISRKMILRLIFWIKLESPQILPEDFVYDEGDEDEEEDEEDD